MSPRRSLRPDPRGYEPSFENAHHEAQTIFSLVARGIETLASARALIGVPPRIRRVLQTIGFPRTLDYRDDVSREFEALVLRSGKPAP